MEIESVTETTVSISGMTLDADQLTEFIEDLALVRAHLNPPVSAAPNLAQEIASEADPLFQVGVAADGRVMLCLRHSGLGWLHFDLPPQSAQRISRQLSRASGAPLHSEANTPRH